VVIDSEDKNIPLTGLWERKVINPETKEYWQVADLPVEYRKFDVKKKYPITIVKDM
jgi:hypothetical protein